VNRLGAVVIGRNEAQKLRRSLSSVLEVAAPIVFVDSASEDGSVDLARTMAVDVLELDRSAPITVARARNAGLARLVHLAPEVDFVQFVDADSEMVSTWFAHAGRVLAENSRVAVVFGRVRERHPRRSLYARLYQTEFDAHFSQADVCGGMAMMRISALQHADGFNSTMLGFEDAELSFRLRRAGWHVSRLDAEMAVHEAGMARPAQWWQRQVRGGYARGQEAALHGRSLPRSALRESCSIWFWGLLLPLLACGAIGPTRGLSMLLLAGYPVLFLRIYRRMQRRGSAPIDAALYAASCVLGKFPQLVGQMRFHAEHLRPRSRLRQGHL
jgi:GT2 family glycosyltransferase